MWTLASGRWSVSVCRQLSALGNSTLALTNSIGALGWVIDSTRSSMIDLVLKDDISVICFRLGLVSVRCSIRIVVRP